MTDRFDEMGRPKTAEKITDWLLSEKGLATRARQLIESDRRDGTALFPWWVEFLLFGSPHGGFNLNGEPVHDARTVFDLKASIDRDDFRRINWDKVRAVLMEPCNCEHETHFGGKGGHLHMRVPAGQKRAQHVGRVCDECADTHMKSYLVAR